MSETAQLASEIQARIKNLETLFEQPLKDEMQSLKLSLIENPAACMLLMDEDIGELVKNLRRTVTVAVVTEAEGKKKPSTKTKPLTGAELEAALAAEGF
jgi:hypothetical protein